MKTKPSRGITLQQKPHFRTKSASKQPKGFALIVTLTLMILLTVIAVGLLSLSSITLRTSSQSSSLAEARANAKLAVMMALSALQKEAGDDRRITADAGILDPNTAPKPIGQEIKAQYAVAGVWDSWSPKVAEDPMNKAVNNYATEKNNRFRRWLVSTNVTSQARNQSWYQNPVPSARTSGPLVRNNWPMLFEDSTNNFSISAEPIQVNSNQNNNTLQGRLAYAVVQENTKAKINIGGPNQLAHPNDALMSQPRPSLANIQGFKQPDTDFDLLASRVLSLSQLKIKDEIIGSMIDQNNAADPMKYSYHLTTASRGLLTDVVNGGLKVDLSLAFEMPSNQFAQDKWGDFDNPFRSSDYRKYQGQVPLYKPMAEDGGCITNVNFGAVSREVKFPGNAVATFDALRSHYRSPQHLYGGAGAPTAHTRMGIHPAVAEGFNDQQTGFLKAARPLQPVLDRLAMTMNMQINSEGKLCLTLNPYVVIWNPYNVAIESPGLVVSMLMDFPFNANGFRVRPARTGSGAPPNLTPGDLNLSRFMQPDPAIKEGRSKWPYFYFYLSSNGNQNKPSPIRLAPGELRAFHLKDRVLRDFVRLDAIPARTYDMMPVDDSRNLNFTGGIAIPLHKANAAWDDYGFDNAYKWNQGDRFTGTLVYGRNQFEHFIIMEDARNFSTSLAINPLKNSISEMHFTAPMNVVSRQGAGEDKARINSALLLSPVDPLPFGKITFYRRTAQSGSTAGFQDGDLLFTTNPRSAFSNPILSNFDKSPTGPQYDAVFETRLSTVDSPFDIFRDGSAYSGMNHSPSGGRRSLPFFEVPQSPLLSLAAFQHLDISTSAFSTAYQIGNSWAMPYLSRSEATTQVKSGHRISLVSSGSITMGTDFPVVDFSYLANEALWDKYFFSGIASDISPSSNGGPDSWTREDGKIKKGYTDVLADFINSPSESPLRNTSMILNTGGKTKTDLVSDLTAPEGCLKVASYLMVDGAFNVNSISLGAWTALLSGLQDANFTVDGASNPPKNLSFFSRMSRPRNEANDNWEGYRGLTSAQIDTLALEIVKEVQKRGPFLSLGEFVNRQLTSSQEGLAGAIQAAIGNAKLNSNVQYKEIDNKIYSDAGRNNIVKPDNHTGVAIPGYLTQADVLNSIGPRLTARSDTFTIRGYGESFDAATNRIKAKVVIEAVVQRVPEFVDSLDPAYTPILGLKSTVNRIFGRRFEIVSYRELAPEEL